MAFIIDDVFLVAAVADKWARRSVTLLFRQILLNQVERGDQQDMEGSPLACPP
jgi:hypothetical protein